jgi:beta-N-acetylhexosaminidase
MKKWILGTIIILVLAGAITGWLLYQNQARAPQKQPDISKPAPMPKPKPEPSYVDTLLSKMTLRDKIASLLVMNTAGTDPVVLGQFMNTYKLGGFILMGENMPMSDAVLQAETAALRGGDAKVPRLVSTDEEGGTVKRLLGDNYASALTLKNQPIAATTQAFSDRSAMVQSVGITLNFGIIADTTANPDSFIYDRVLGTTPGAAAQRVTAAVNASKGKTLSTIKHFPGHGETVADSHLTIPTIPISYDEWLARDEPPFAAGIAAGADVVMAGHLRYSAVDSRPASLSKKWHDILRGTLGFKGVIMTDAMGMLLDSGDVAYADPVRDAVLALQAGNTMLLYVTDPTASPTVLIDGIAASVKHGDLSEALITQNARLALELRSKSAVLVK